MDLVEARLKDFATVPRHPWERARLAIVSRLIARHGGIHSGDIVLDVGCGDSYVVESLAQQQPGARFYAVDSAFTPELIAHFSPRLPSNVALFSALDEVPADGRASLVLLMDVMEHVEDDRGLLHTLLGRSFFSSATRLLITVPSYPGLWSAHDRFLGHYRRYTRRSLQAVLHGVGLDALEAGYFFFSLLPTRVLEMLKDRAVGTAPEEFEGLIAWGGGTTLTRVIAGALEWDGRISMALNRLGVTLPGLSTFAVCKRSA